MAGQIFVQEEQKMKIDITAEITRVRYSSMLPSSTKGRGSLISGAELRLCRFTPGGTSIFDNTWARTNWT